MKIAAIADLHGQLPATPRNVDLIAIAGDICPDFSRSKSQNLGMQATWLDKVFRPWLEAADVPVVAVWGNHDYIGEATGEHGALFDSLPWTILQDETVEIDGLRIHGTPWVPRLTYWAFYGTARTLEMRAELIPEGLDLLISHGPPHRVGDLVPAPKSQARIDKYHQYSDEFVGDPSLNAAIEKQKPALTVVGHIHEARGIYNWKGHPVANVAAVDGHYVMRDDPWLIVDTEKGESSQHFSTGDDSPLRW